MLTRASLRRSVASRGFVLALSVPVALTTGCEAILGLRDTEATRAARPAGAVSAGGSEAAGSSAAAGSTGARSGNGGSGAHPLAGAGGIAGGEALHGDGADAGDAGGGDAGRGDGENSGGKGARGGRASSDDGGSSGVAEFGGAPGADGGAGTVTGGAGLGGNAGTATSGAGFGGNAGATTGGAGTGGVGGTAPVIPTGALVGADGSCLAIAETTNGAVTDATAVHRACADDPAQIWSFDDEAHLHAAVEAAFLDVNGAPGDTGEIVRVAPAVAPAAAEQQWAFDGVHVVNDAGWCIDVPYGDFFDYAHVQIYVCHAADAQSWSVTPLGQIRHGAYCMDLPGSNTDDGTRIQVYTCYDDPPDNQRFVLEQGRLKPRNSGKCIGVAGDPTINQTPLEVESCDSTGPNALGQSFSLLGPIMNRGLCLDLGTPDAVADPVALQPCAGTPEQTWAWFF